MTTSDALLMGLLLDTPPLDVSGGGGSRYTVESLTFSGDLITPATRALGQAQTFTDFEPLLEYGVAPYPAYTNKTIQSVPGASATTNVTKGGDVAATLTKVVDPLAPVANASGEVWELDNSLGSTDATVDFSGATGATTAHSISIVAKVTSGTPVLSLGTAGTGPAGVNITATQWPGEAGTDNRTRGANLTPGANTDVIRVTAPAGCVVRFVAPQLQTGAIVTPWRRTDGSSQSTTAGRIQMPVDGLVTPTQGAVFARLRLPYANTDDPVVDPTYWQWADSSSEYVRSAYSNSFNAARLLRASSPNTGDGQVAASWAANSSVTVGGTWAGNGQRAMFNGLFGGLSSGVFIPVLAATHADIGSAGVVFSNRQVSGNTLWFATFAGTLTDDDAAALNGLGDTPPTWAQLVGALTATAQVTGLWQAKTNQFFKAA